MWVRCSESLLLACLCCTWMCPVATLPAAETGPNGQIPEHCTLPPDKGVCRSFVHKWFYDTAAKKCFTFIYGGCPGNDNRFDSQADCLLSCAQGNYTLPPYLRKPDELPKPPAIAKPKPDRVTFAPITTTKAPVPLAERGEELTFAETGHHKVFMFAHSNTFIQLDGNRIPTFQLRLCREISFQFRTKLPHGLLVYHSVKDRPEGLDPYALYIIVENGQLKVVHVFGKYSTSVTVGKGLNRDEWHSVMVRIDVHGARLLAKVDDKQEETNVLGLNPSINYGVSSDLTSVVLIGGLSPEEKLHGVKYIIESFVGCIKDMVLSAGKAASDLLPIRPLIATKHENIVEGCIDKCRTSENLCFVGSRCVNHYNGLTCDCFGRKYEGEQCDTYTATILTMRGSSYVSYRVYDWKDRVHSRVSRISLFFKTRYDDSVLFYASGEPHGHHYVAASIKNETVHVKIDLGDGPVEATLGNSVNDNYWHNLTIAQHDTDLTLRLDHEQHDLQLSGPRKHLYIDPEIYFGGGPELHKKKGLVSSNNFPGCLKYVFFNDVSVLYELQKASPKVHYHGVLRPELYETDVEVIPITFPFPASHIWWPSAKGQDLYLKFDFKSNRNMAVLVSSEVITAAGKGYWEVRVVTDEIRFELVPNTANNVTHLTAVKFDNRGGWHAVELSYVKGEVKLTVDHKNKNVQLFGLEFEMGERIIIGSGSLANVGIVGCMRDMVINGVSLEPRAMVRTEHAVGDVSLDNCQLVDPCTRPNACEHGGKCSVRDDRVVCDCKGTGYLGKNCHFAEFRKTCEELALLGYTKPDVYLIDIDGNGRFPPAHVKCEFQSLEDSTKTIVEHNLPSQVDVRSAKEEDFSFSIKYREFSAEMLQELISHSLRCSQYIKYDCYKAPLDLHSATWFVSSGNRDIVDYVGEIKRGACPCALNRTCMDPKQSCNCDISEGKWLSDEGYYTKPGSLGLTEMVFLQQKELDQDALGRITLGPLECVETNTQQYVVTFTSSQSYIEVPGWRKGDISFSFRTTGEKAILLYQPPIRPHHPSFMVALTSDFQLTFNFTLNTGKSRELAIKSRRRLNSGEWQKIWIDYNEHHVRFMINTDYEMLDLLPVEEFGPFEGSMFIGGATEDLLKVSSVRQGLIGCFRGLVVNGEILDIYSYMSVHLSEIIKDCKPSCDPNPCKNGAKCKELWSTFQCVCENPWAQEGAFCETNINVKALTFLTPESFLKKNYVNAVSELDRQILNNLLRDNILINMRTYEQHSLVMYTNDHLNNFVQLHIEKGRYVVFTFNSGPEIYNITVEYPGLNSGRSVQVAIVRTMHETILHVNDRNASTAITVNQLTNYSNRPWLNPDKEVLSPQRPPAPPTEYFQINLGGYDPANLIASSSSGPALPGYVGCIRGLKAGNILIDLTANIPQVPTAQMAGIVAGCKMKCDEHPCKNQGVCIEDFQKGEASCDCQFTSYYGEFCDEEKGADFGGDSVLQRKFVLEGSVHQVKVQLAFSSTDPRQWNSVLLLLQTENKRSYYLLVALTSEGELVFEEDREGSALGARIKDRNFLNGARHSVYYQRTGDNAVLMVDREEVPLAPILVLTLTDLTSSDKGANEVQVGGLNTSDPRFTAYKSYSGCLSNVLVEVNAQTMKPLDEYMFFTKTGGEDVNVRNAPGVRIAPCAFFDATNKPRPGLSLNISLGRDKAWVEDPPARIPYKSLYSEASTEEDNTFQVVFLVMVVVFGVIVTGSLCEVYRSHRQYKKRKEEEAAGAALIWSKGHKVQYSEPGPKPPNLTAYKNVSRLSVTVLVWAVGSDLYRWGLQIRASVSSHLVFTDKGREVPQQEVKTTKSTYNNVEPPKPEVKFSVPLVEPLPQPDKMALPEARRNSVPTSEQELEWDPLGESTELLAESVEDLTSSMQNGIDTNTNVTMRPVSTRPGQLAPLGSISEGRSINTNGSAKRGQTNSAIFPPILEDDIDVIGPRSKEAPPYSFLRALSPVFLSEERRTYGNPISYLGGPRLAANPSRASKESVLSVD
uniref:Uncharacterized protein n=1 Tax=Timema shepardi TaxID=629360 RepID=A0A7R9ALV5_TIMSH|nr:unnamed protein product [Timema shepardi]